MDLDAITPSLLERTLRSWQQAEELPSEILALHALAGSYGTSPAELSLKLFDLLSNLVIEALHRYRHLVGLPVHLEKSPAEGQIRQNLAADFQVGNTTLEAWSVLHYRYLTPTPLDVADLSAIANVNERQIRRRLTTGHGLLVDALRRVERDAHLRFRSLHLQRRLPPADYAPLIGVESYVDHLVQLLSTASGIRLISIEGLGGIGKTALAQAIAARMAQQGRIADILWIRVQDEEVGQSALPNSPEQGPENVPEYVIDGILADLATQLGLVEAAELPLAEKLERLHPILTATPYLVVIDNLETAAIRDALLPLLHPLAAATRFLLTSRHTLESFPFVYCFAVPELSLANCRQLMESVLAPRPRQAPALDPATVQEIYETVGGVPQALKLIAAQLRRRFPPADILEGLRYARHEAHEKMFARIYRRTWRLLDDNARALLLSMLQVAPDGEILDWIRQTSNLPKEDFEKALAQLLDTFLLEVTGTYEMPCYRLHRLTATFLLADLLLDWHGESAPDSPQPAIVAEEKSWHEERMRWTAYYEQHLHTSLTWAMGYIEQSRRQPTALKPHMASLLTLLRQAQLRSSLHSPAVDVISLLHPWPSHWGFWREWERALRFAIEVSARLGWQERQALFLSYLAHILFNTGNLEKAAEMGRGAVDLGMQSDTPLALAHGGSVIVSTLVISGRKEEAELLLAELIDQVAIRESEDQQQVQAMAMLELMQADLLRRNGDLREAVVHVRRIIALLEELGDVDANLLAHAYRDSSIIALALGDYVGAAADLKEAEAIFEEEGDAFSQSLVLSSLGLLYWNSGDLVRAESVIREGIKLNEELNARWHLIHEIGNLGLVFLSQGNLQQALIHFETQRKMGLQFGEIKESMRAIGNRGIARMHLQEYGTARADLEEELAFFDRQGFRAYIGCSLVNLSWCYNALGQQEKAGALAERASALGEETGSIALQIVALRCVAEYLPTALKAEHLQRALELARNKRRLDEASVLLSLAGLAENDEERDTLWRAGCQLLAEMNALAWVKDRLPQDPPRLPLLY